MWGGGLQFDDLVAIGPELCQIIIMAVSTSISGRVIRKKREGRKEAIRTRGERILSKRKMKLGEFTSALW